MEIQSILVQLVFLILTLSFILPLFRFHNEGFRFCFRAVCVILALLCLANHIRTVCRTIPYIPEHNPSVYVTDYGDHYHVEGCGYLRSKHKLSLYNAFTKRYTPCSRCDPPRFSVEDQGLIRESLIDRTPDLYEFLMDPVYLLIGGVWALGVWFFTCFYPDKGWPTPSHWYIKSVYCHCAVIGSLIFAPAAILLFCGIYTLFGIAVLIYAFVIRPPLTFLRKKFKTKTHCVKASPSPKPSSQFTPTHSLHAHTDLNSDPYHEDRDQLLVSITMTMDCERDRIASTTASTSLSRKEAAKAIDNPSHPPSSNPSTPTSQICKSIWDATNRYTKATQSHLQRKQFMYIWAAYFYVVTKVVNDQVFVDQVYSHFAEHARNHIIDPDHRPHVADEMRGEYCEMRELLNRSHIYPCDTEGREKLWRFVSKIVYENALPPLNGKEVFITGISILTAQSRSIYGHQGTPDVRYSFSEKD